MPTSQPYGIYGLTGVRHGAKLAVGGGWATHVGILVDLLEGRKARPFFSTAARERKAFEAAL